MAFDPQQQRKLSAKLRSRHVRSRQVDGGSLRYLEGWHVIAEANRIFGFDGWERETQEARCVYTKQNGNRYTAAYVTRIRIAVHAGDRRIVRDGSGAGEATTDTAGTAHEMALKAAETDATKRALVTFGNPFGLSLYATPHVEAPFQSGQRDDLQKTVERSNSPEPTEDHTPKEPTGHIEKSALTLGEPKRRRSPEHMRFVASRPCAICRKNRCQAHHVTFAQPRAMGRKVSDEFTVPLCAEHHREVHMSGDERRWWHSRGIDAMALARELWESAATPRDREELKMPVLRNEGEPHIESLAKKLS